jgi:DNA repair protein SbcC/Rad50
VGSVEVISQTLRSEDDERLYQVVLDRQRRLNSIEREIASALQSSNLPASTVEVDSVAASNAYAAWELANGETIAKLQSRISTLLPSIKMPRDRFEFAEEAMPLLESEYLQLIDRAEQGRQDLRRTVEIEKELDSIRAQVNIIDSEIGQISSDSEVLASALGELSSYIKTDVCPVCDRDFAELGSESLSSQYLLLHRWARTLLLGNGIGSSWREWISQYRGFQRSERDGLGAGFQAHDQIRCA